jgi:phosphoglycolate phosphatase-like HAD superfamily hydrolase
MRQTAIELVRPRWKLGIVTTKHRVGVGDSEHDIHGARAAGMTTIGAYWGALSRNKLLAAKPDFVAERPEDSLGIKF